MGSSQSLPNDNDNFNPNTKTRVEKTFDDTTATFDASNNNNTINDSGKNNNNTSSNKKRKKEKQLTGMALVDHQCQKQDKAYQKCALEFQQKYLLLQYGQSNQWYQDKQQECEALFQDYRACYLKGIKEELFDKKNSNNNNKKTPAAGSLLGQFEREQQQQEKEKAQPEKQSKEQG